MELNGKKVIITGGVKGLGRSMVEALLHKGTVVTVLDSNAQGLAELKGQHADVNCVECNVADYQQVVQVIAGYHADFKSADVLINNAGILYSAPLVRIGPSGLEKHDIADWQKVLDADLNSVFFMTLCVVEKMITTRTRGVIVNISSISSSGNAGQSAYSAAKAGVNALTMTWAKELGPLGIRVVAVAPGFVDTDSTNAALSPTVIKGIVDRIPLRRLGRPEEVAQGVISVIENEYFNGRVFELDGGLIV